MIGVGAQPAAAATAPIRPLLKRTPFHGRTAPLVRAETWRRWAGYQVASAYEPHPDREYAAIRNSAALIDISPLQKYLVGGPHAVRLLDRMVTRDVTRCAVGQVLYTPWCDAAGKVIDDGTVSRLDERTWRLTSAEPNVRWLSMNAAGLDVTIADVSAHTAALALQGPLARDILAQACTADLRTLGYFRLLHTTLGDIPVTVSRTGYTGDLGFELWMDAQHAVEVWDTLIEAGTPYGVTPAGIWALDIARIEAGLLMLDVDYVSAHRAHIPDQTSSPFELGLGWTVSKGKGPYNGRVALERERVRPQVWAFTGVEVHWESFERAWGARGLAPHVPAVAWRTSAPLLSGDRQVGYATSGCWSPLLKKYIALAHVQRAHASPGAPLAIELGVEHRRVRVEAVVRALPFFNPERKRA